MPARSEHRMSSDAEDPSGQFADWRRTFSRRFEEFLMRASRFLGPVLAGVALASLSAPAAALEVGERFPEIALPSLDGEPMSIASLRGGRPRLEAEPRKRGAYRPAGSFLYNDFAIYACYLALC